MPNIELANLVLRFGDRVLMDFRDEIFIPAFYLEEPRKWRGNEFVFYSCNQSTVRMSVKEGEEVIERDYDVLYGRLIKNQTIERRQLYLNGVLTQAPGELRTSPSSFFVFFFNKHKLFFVPEMPFAPSLGDFEYCLAYYLSKTRMQYIRRLRDQGVQRLIDAGIPKSRALKEANGIRQLSAEIPRPNLNITYMPSPASLREFFGKYAILKNVEIKFKPVNDEIDDDAMYAALREEAENVGSLETKIIHRSKDGLNKEEIIRSVETVARTGNYALNAAGKDDDGNQLNASNDDFRLRHPMGDLPGPGDEAAALDLVHGEIQQMYNMGVIREM
jgi:hypothetical protein